MMTAGSILLATALLLLVGLYILRPLLIPYYHRSTHMSERELLEHEKAGLLAHIRAVDFDFETGKIPAEEYERDRGRLLQEAAVVLRRLDHLPADQDVDAQIEAAIGRLRKRPAAAAAVVAAAVAEMAPAAVAEPADRFCPQCGAAAAPDHLFCPKCGNQLK